MHGRRLINFNFYSQRCFLLRIKIELKRNLNKVIDAIDSIAGQRMTEACIHVQNKTKEKLSGKRSGRVYRVPGTKKTYVASAPGEPPAVMTGQLRSSIKYRIVGELRALKGEVGSELKKAPMLEFGTSKMAARPFLRPTFQEELPVIKNILSRRWF